MLTDTARISLYGVTKICRVTKMGTPQSFYTHGSVFWTGNPNDDIGITCRPRRHCVITREDWQNAYEITRYRIVGGDYLYVITHHRLEITVDRHRVFNVADGMIRSSAPTHNVIHISSLGHFNQRGGTRDRKCFRTYTTAEHLCDDIEIFRSRFRKATKYRMQHAVSFIYNTKKKS